MYNIIFYIYTIRNIFPITTFLVVYSGCMDGLYCLSRIFLRHDISKDNTIVNYQS